MRMLTRVFAICLAMLGAGAASGLEGCDKEVFIYFDVSGSMRIPQNGSTTLQLFTQTVDGLLGREGFMEPGDRTTIIAFAQRPAAVIASTVDTAAAAAAVRAIGEGASRLIGAETGQIIGIGDPNRTSIGSVLIDVQHRLDPQRRQIFIVASDFADDPEIGDCKQTNGRAAQFKALAENARRQLPSDVPLRLILLTSTVSQASCDGADAFVSSAVKTSLGKIIGAREVQVSHLTNVIAGNLRKAAADSVTLKKGPAARDPYLLSVIVRNPNPFPVSVVGLAFTSSGSDLPTIVRQNATLACGGSANLDAVIPEALRGHKKLQVSAVANTPAAPPLDIPSERVTIANPELHVFRNFRRDTYAVELTVDSTPKGVVLLKVSGIPGRERTTYHVDTSAGPRRVVLASPGRDGHRPDDVAVTAAGSPLYVTNERGTADEVAEAPVQPTKHDGGENVPFFVQWAAVISAAGILLSALKLIPGTPHFWWGWFEKAHDTHIFTGVLDKVITGIGLTSVTFASIGSYANLASTSLGENLLWAFATGGFALFVSRSIVIRLWPLIIERQLRTTVAAVRMRTFMLFVVVIVSICIAGYVFILLHSSLGNFPIYRPVRAS